MSPPVVSDFGPLFPNPGVPDRLTFFVFVGKMAAFFECETQMQCGGEGEPHKAPTVSPSPPHPHSLSFSPNRPKATN